MRHTLSWVLEMALLAFFCGWGLVLLVFNRPNKHDPEWVKD